MLRVDGEKDFIRVMILIIKGFAVAGFPDTP